MWRFLLNEEGLRNTSCSAAGPDFAGAGFAGAGFAGPGFAGTGFVRPRGCFGDDGEGSGVAGGAVGCGAGAG